MSPTRIEGKCSQSVRRFPSAREACRHTLQNARTGSGYFIPLTVQELRAQLDASGLVLNASDIEALLRELVADGDAVEIDEQTGFRWTQTAA